MEILALGLIAIIAFVYIMASKNAKPSPQQLKKQAELSALDAQIIEKQNTLTGMAVDHTVSLTKSQIAVLDKYDRSNIKIPADILEDLVANNIQDEKTILQFIENQRDAWKRENGKKVSV